MIKPDEACQYAQVTFPDIASRLTPETGIYDTLEVMREYACEQAREHNYSLLQNCFTLAAALYETGSGTVRSAVENVFVYSFSRILSVVAEDKRQIKLLIPDSLQAAYMNQVFHRGY